MRPVLGALLTLGVLALSACGGAKAVDTGSSTLLVGERSSESMDALLDGTLVEVDGCVGVEATDGGVEFVVVWPYGTSVADDEPVTIEVPDVGEVAVGDEVQVGGGVVQGEEVGGLTIPDFCADHEVWLAG